MTREPLKCMNWKLLHNCIMQLVRKWYSDLWKLLSSAGAIIWCLHRNMLVPLYLPLRLHSYPPVSLYLAYLAPYYRITQVTPRLLYTSAPLSSLTTNSGEREKLTKCGHSLISLQFLSANPLWTWCGPYFCLLFKCNRNITSWHATGLIWNTTFPSRLLQEYLTFIPLLTLKEYLLFDWQNLTSSQISGLLQLQRGFVWKPNFINMMGCQAIKRGCACSIKQITNENSAT